LSTSRLEVEFLWKGWGWDPEIPCIPLVKLFCVRFVFFCSLVRIGAFRMEWHNCDFQEREFPKTNSSRRNG